MKKLLICCLLAVTMNSCSILAFIFFGITPTNKYFPPYSQLALYSEDYKPNSKGQIRTDGVYLPFDTATSRFNIDADGLVYGRLFYHDGSYATIVCDPDSISNSDLSVKLADAQGIYSIYGDTVIIEAYLKGKKWFLEDAVFKIEGQDTLKLILQEFYHPTGSNRINLFKGDFMYRFVPATQLPDSRELKVKREKWLWRDKNEWKEYRKSLKAWEKQRHP